MTMYRAEATCVGIVRLDDAPPASGFPWLALFAIQLPHARGEDQDEVQLALPVERPDAFVVGREYTLRVDQLDVG